MSIRPFILIVALAAIPAVRTRAADSAKPPTYAEVHAIFAKNCLSCHDAKEAEGELVLETHESLMKDTVPNPTSGNEHPTMIPSKIPG